MIREFFHDPVLKKLFALGVTVRLVMLVLFWGQPLYIVDERHYDAIAMHIVEQGQFLAINGKPTAIRPPLYPLFLSLCYRIFGDAGQDAVRLLQSGLSLGAGVLLFALCRTIVEERSTRIAVGLFLLYPSLLFFNCLVLTEILFLFLFLASLTFLARVLEPVQSSRVHHDYPDQRKRALGNFSPETSSYFSRIDVFCATWSSCKLLSLRNMALAGLCLGLATLTRSITYPMAIPLGALLLLLLNPLRWRTWAGVAMFLILFVGVLSPWIVRNYKLFHAFVPVDTMGGLNLYMGNYESTPLHRAWAAVDINDEKAWYRGHEKELKEMDEAQKQKWAINEGLVFMREHPGLTALRAVIKAANFWGMDRALIAGMKENFFQAFRATPVKVVSAAMILAGYFAVMLLGFSGLAGRLLCKSSPLDLLVIFIIFYFTAMHALVFGHSRYHLPLIPLLCVYAGWTLVHWKKVWATHPRAAKNIACCIALIFISIWMYEIGLGSKAEISHLVD